MQVGRFRHFVRWILPQKSGFRFDIAGETLWQDNSE
jgi:hypothetical protein